MNNTLRNGFAVLEYLAESAGDCTVKGLAEHFGLPASHVHRLLATLTATGYVERTPRRKYRVSLKILTLANARREKLVWRHAARPHGQQLARDLAQPTWLTANHHGFSVIVDAYYPLRFSGDTGPGIGQIHSVNRSACGKICAAHAAPAELEELLRHADWSEKTPSSVTDPEVFRRELVEIRRRGHARMAGESNPDVGAVAAPVYDKDGGLVGALGVVLPEGGALWTPDLWDRFAESARAAARSISFALGLPLEEG